MGAFSENRHLKEVLSENKQVLQYLNQNELEKLMDYQNYSGLLVEKTEKIIKKWKNFI